MHSDLANKRLLEMQCAGMAGVRLIVLECLTAPICQHKS